MGAYGYPSYVFVVFATHETLLFPSQSFWGWLSICASGYSTCIYLWYTILFGKFGKLLELFGNKAVLYCFRCLAIF